MLSGCLSTRQHWQGALPCAGRCVLLCLLLKSLHIQLCFQCCAGHPKALGWLEAFAPVLVIPFFQGIWFQALKHELIILLQFCFSTALPLLIISCLSQPFFLQYFFDRGKTHLLQGLLCQVLLVPACHHSKPHLPTTACTHKQEHDQRTHRVSNSSFPLFLPPSWGSINSGITSPLLVVGSVQTKPVPWFLWAGEKGEVTLEGCHFLVGSRHQTLSVEHSSSAEVSAHSSDSLLK